VIAASDVPSVRDVQPPTCTSMLRRAASRGFDASTLPRAAAQATLLQASRGFAAAASEPKDLSAAWASLAAYDSKAAGAFLNGEAAKAKAELGAAGYALAREYVVDHGKSLNFDGTVEVDSFDAANLWLREADGRAILAFRGSDTQKNLANVRSTETCSMYGHRLQAAVAEGEFAPLVALMSAGDFSGCRVLAVTGHSLGGGCASMLAVLMNDKSDPLGFGEAPIN